MTLLRAGTTAFAVVGLSAAASAPALASNRTPVPTFPLEAETPLTDVLMSIDSGGAGPF